IMTENGLCINYYLQKRCRQIVYITRNFGYLSSKSEFGVRMFPSQEDVFLYPVLFTGTAIMRIPW
ncbi:MAG: hypothetical protein LIO46_00410, partial [Clostridiales bacterium]|nr:hypothetical protein [Clostridiales bacterium]